MKTFIEKVKNYMEDNGDTVKSIGLLVLLSVFTFCVILIIATCDDGTEEQHESRILEPVNQTCTIVNEEDNWKYGLMTYATLDESKIVKGSYGTSSTTTTTATTTTKITTTTYQNTTTEEEYDIGYVDYIDEDNNEVISTYRTNMTYLGNLKITGYVATGNPTASGYYPYVGGVAMSRSYGLPYGTTIYIEGLGYYTLNDTGCDYGIVDVFCNTIQECYNITSYKNVYIVN